MQVKIADRVEKYLDIYVKERTRGADPTHEKLEKRFWEKFIEWKLSLMSHPGRLTLIKSMLSSLPI
jgi:hypothetical protein